MTKLHHLRSRLRILRLGRRLFRWGAAWSAVAALALVILLLLLAADVAFEPSVAARVVLLSLAALTLLVGLWRLAWPWLFVRETDLDMALLVERRLGHSGRSDLAAALQFESPRAIGWGSSQLEQAVIDRVHAETQHANVFIGANTAPLVQRVLVLAAIVAVAGAVALTWPRHLEVFFHRMALGGEHYPSRTVLRQVVINDHVVLDDSVSLSAPKTARCAEGEPLWIAVYSAGALPEEGDVDLLSRAGGQRRTLALRRFDPEQASRESNPARRAIFDALRRRASPDEEAAIYFADLDRLMEPLDYQIFLGDAWTDRAAIEMVPLPVIEPKITVTAPDYARHAGESSAPLAGARQISVLEGSRIELEITSVNSKPLREAMLTVTRGGVTTEFPLQPADREKLRWRLDAIETPLSEVTEEFRYEVAARDEDGLQPASPVAGVVRIRPDRPPRIAARVVTQVVLPTAAPVVNLDLADDYGVLRPTLELKITREDGSQETRTLTDLSLRGYNENEQPDATEAVFPLTGEQLPWRGGCRIDLAPLRLKKGDRISAVFLVADYRGEGQSRQAQAASQPLELEVSDEAGVYRAALEADRQALEDITEAADLQQQLLNDE